MTLWLLSALLVVMGLQLLSMRETFAAASPATLLQLETSRPENTQLPVWMFR